MKAVVGKYLATRRAHMVGNGSDASGWESVLPSSLKQDGMVPSYTVLDNVPSRAFALVR